MKAYTDLEQSHKLAEILPLESADAHYWCKDSEDLRLGGSFSIDKDLDIPAWSLAALLDVLPKNLDIGRPILATNYRGYYWVSYFDEYMRENKFTSKIYNNPLDACYEMIIKLHEQKTL